MRWMALVAAAAVGLLTASFSCAPDAVLVEPMMYPAKGRSSCFQVAGLPLFGEGAQPLRVLGPELQP